MAEFGRLQLTAKGLALQTKAQIGAALQFTRVGIGDGELNGQPIADLDELIDEKISLPIEGLKTDQRHRATVTAAFSNQDLTEGFYFRELGLYANDPDHGEILYCYANAGDIVEFIPADDGAQIVEKQLNLITIIGNAENVTAVIDESLVYAKQQDLDNLETYVNQELATVQDAVSDAQTTADNAKQTADDTQLALDNLTPGEIGAALASHVGNISNLSTTDKSNLVNAINELFTNVSNGKNTIATAITDMGQAASGSNTFAQLATAIKAISNDANATTAQVLSGRTFYQGGQKRTGTMSNRGNINQTLTSQGQSYTVPAGYHSGSGTVTANISNLSAGNVRSGATVGGVAGNFSSYANGATAAQILTGRSAAVNGSTVNGSMPNRSGHVTGQSVSRSGTTVRIRPQAGYYDGSSGNSVQFSDSNFIAANIREGVSVFGLPGTLKEGAPFATGTAYSVLDGNTRKLQIQGLDFHTPQWIVVYAMQTGGIADAQARVLLYTSFNDIHQGTSTPTSAISTYLSSSNTVDISEYVTVNGHYGFVIWVPGTILPSSDVQLRWFCGRWS